EIEAENNNDSFETVTKKAVQAWNSGTDEQDRKKQFRGEIFKKYPFGISGKHAWQLWAKTGIPVDDIYGVADEYDNTARLLKMIAPGAWWDTLNQLFVPGVPVDIRALVKASGATAKVVELWMQRPSIPHLPMGPGSMSGPALALAHEGSLGAA